MEEVNPLHVRNLADAQPVAWWLDEDPLEPNPHPALVNDRFVDLCIIGAGYTGLWTALLAKERDPARSVIVLEQRETGAGASGRNGGFCSRSLTHGFENGRRRFPKEIATLERLGLENLQAIEATINRYGIDCDFERTGELTVAVEPWQLQELIDQAHERNASGDNVEILTREQVCDRVNSPTYLGGIFDPDGTAMVDPARLVWGLERACLSLGVEIFERTKAFGLHRERDGVMVKTPYAKIHAAKVALGTNVYPSLIRGVRRYVVPVYDFQLVTAPLTESQRASIGWLGREGISDAGNRFHYYRLTADGSILFGGYDAVYHFRSQIRSEYENAPDTFARLASHFITTFPQLEGISFTHAWGGAIDTCSRFSSFWGTAHRGNVAYVLGFTGLGVAATRFGAEVMLDLLDGVENEKTRLKMVRRKPVPFPPEPFRFLAIKLTTWSIERADRREGKRNLWLRLLDFLGIGFDS